MAVLVLGMLMAPAKQSKAAVYKYGSFAVTSLSSTEVTIDYRNVLADYTGLGASVSGYDICVTDLTADSGELLVKQALATEVVGTITGLTPGHTYTIAVKINYQFEYSEPSQGYDFVQIETPFSGISSEVDVVTDSGIAEPVTQPDEQTPSVPQPITAQLAAPAISMVKMVGDNAAVSVVPVVCEGYEFGIFKKSNNALVKTESTILTGTTFYGLSRTSVYIVRARAYVYDSAGNRVYSEWGAGKYMVPQPKIKKTGTKLKKNSINLKWSKVSGASNYTIYMRKRGSGKWYKVKTVGGGKSSYKITKFRGKGFNSYRQNYEVKIKASAKIGGKTYNSTTNDYIYTYTYTRYR